jgi:DNA-binding response OmpR family regulator
MSQQSIKLLHVEDNVADRLLMARMLGSMKEYAFDIVRAATEITAVAELNKGGIDFVILDYRLPLGDGLGCLRKLRQIDPAVPILMISGVTTPEIGAECLHSGADDYMNKQDLTAEKLAASVRKALSRAHSWPTLRSQLLPICKTFIASLDPEFFQALDGLEQTMRQSALSAEQVALLFETVASDLDRSGHRSPLSAVQVVRPIVLEMIERLRGQPPEPAKPTSGS